MNKIQNILKEKMESYNLYKAPVDIIALAEVLGFNVYEMRLNDNISGEILIGPKDESESEENSLGNKLIVVNLADAAVRRRFTIAHEIAHYMLHFDKKNQNGYYAHREESDKCEEEKEANALAAEILMPEDLVNSEINRLIFVYGDNIPYEIKERTIRNKFLVSQPAAYRRLKELNLGK